MLFNDYIVYTYSLEQSLLLCSSFIIRFLFFIMSYIISLQLLRFTPITFYMYCLLPLLHTINTYYFTFAIF